MNTTRHYVIEDISGRYDFISVAGDDFSMPSEIKIIAICDEYINAKMIVGVLNAVYNPYIDRKKNISEPEHKSCQPGQSIQYNITPY